jgi:hypothetical protein
MISLWDVGVKRGFNIDAVGSFCIDALPRRTTFANGGKQPRQRHENVTKFIINWKLRRKPRHVPWYKAGL